MTSHQERIMKEGKGEGEDHEAATHLIEISELTHAARITNNFLCYKITTCQCM